MKILIVGSRHFASYESSCARYFERSECDVEIWDSKSCFHPPLRKSWWRMSRAARKAYDAGASVAFVRKAISAKPDVIFMPKAENLHSRAVREAKERTKARLVVWYPDNPFRAENTSINILRNLERTDLFYIWGKYLVDPLVSAGCRRVQYLPFGFDPELHDLRVSDVAKDIPCQHVGSYSEEKRNALLPLAGCGLQIWGPGWEIERKQKGPLASCVRGAGLYGREMVDAYRRAIVVANPIRLQNMPAHNLRTMEAAGIGGGVVLTQRTAEQARELFLEDAEILCYSDEPEMREKAHWAVSHLDESAAMAAKASARVFREHLLFHRTQKILEDLQT